MLPKSTLKPLAKLLACLTGLLLTAIPGSAVIADPAGRSYTTTVLAWASAIVQASAPSCSNKPSNPSPGDICGDPPVYSFPDAFCNPLGQWPCKAGERYDWQAVTVNNPPATVNGTVDCTFGAAGWCVSDATFTIAGSEPLAGYSIWQIAGIRNGAPFSCAGSVCTQAITETPADTFVYQSYSTFGDSSYASTSAVRVDATAPTVSANVSGTPGNSGWYVSPVVVSLSGFDATSGIGSLTFNGATYSVPVTITTEGLSSHTYLATDLAGNASSINTLDVMIDTVPPSSRVTPPASLNVAGRVELTGIADDATSGVAGVEVSIDNGLNWSPATYSSGVWRFTLNTTAVPDGPLTVQSRATDVAGNVEPFASSATDAVDLYVDNTAPEPFIALECPLPGQNNWCHGPVTMQLGARDAGVGVTSLTYTHKGQTVTLNGSSALVIDGEGGMRDIHLYATDAVGNRSLETSVTIQVDGAPPVASFILPITGQASGDLSVLNVSVTDSESGIERWTLQVFDVGGQSVFWREFFEPFTGGIAWEGVGLPDGTYFAEIFARDRAGLESHVERTPFMLATALTSTPTNVTISPVFVAPATATEPPTSLPTSAPTAATLPSPTPIVAMPASQPVVAMQPEYIFLGGVVFRDANGNGRRDAGEPGMSSITVRVYEHGLLISTVLSERDGRYATRLPRGKRYLLELAVPDGLSATTPASAVVLENATAAEADFGLNAKPSGFVQLSLFALLGFLIAWLFSTTLDRRPSAIWRLAHSIEWISAERRRVARATQRSILHGKP